MTEPSNGGRVPASSLRAQLGGASPGQEGIEPTANPREWLEAMRRHLRLAVGVAGSGGAIAAYLGYNEPLLYQIGRAAGRGRGENSGGAGSLKKKKDIDMHARCTVRITAV